MYIMKKIFLCICNLHYLILFKNINYGIIANRFSLILEDCKDSVLLRESMIFSKCKKQQ